MLHKGVHEEDICAYNFRMLHQLKEKPLEIISLRERESECMCLSVSSSATICTHTSPHYYLSTSSPPPDPPNTHLTSLSSPQHTSSVDAHPLSHPTPSSLFCPRLAQHSLLPCSCSSCSTTTTSSSSHLSPAIGPALIFTLYFLTRRQR